MSLAMSYNIRKASAKKMSKGGEVSNEKLHPDHEASPIPMMKGIAQKIMDKHKLAAGGVVEPESEHDDFLELGMDESDGADLLEDMHYPEHDEDPIAARKAKIAAIMNKVR